MIINEETIWLITLWIYNLLWIDSLFVLLNLGVGQKVSFNVNYVFPIIPFIVPRTINWLYMIWLFYVFLWNFWDFCLFSWYWNKAHKMIANFTDIQCPYFENMSLTANRLRVSYVGKISFLMSSDSESCSSKCIRASKRWTIIIHCIRRKMVRCYHFTWWTQLECMCGLCIVHTLALQWTHETDRNKVPAIYLACNNTRAMQIYSSILEHHTTLLIPLFVLSTPTHTCTLTNFLEIIFRRW